MSEANLAAEVLALREAVARLQKQNKTLRALRMQLEHEVSYLRDLILREKEKQT